MKTFSAIILLVLAVSVQADCPTADDVAVQNTLDSVAAAGGGTVQLEARVYTVCQPLIVGSNVHLRGAGRGGTIVRGAAVTPTCKVRDDAAVCAVIGAVATNNTSISDLTIDMKTNSYDANGIAFLPAGGSYQGQVATNGLVERVEVVGAPGLHTYAIWNLRGQHMRIISNWIDGGSTTNSHQEGVETYGGHDVLIAKNTVHNIGTACIAVVSAGLADSETSGVIVTNNNLENCQMGVLVGTANIGGDEYNEDTQIRGNVITKSRLIGVDVQVMSSTHVRNLLISRNTIRDVSGSDDAAGIRLIPIDAIDAGGVSATTIDGNLISGIDGLHGQGIRSVSYPNVRILQNTITNTAAEGIFAVDCSNLEINGNRVERSGTIGVYVGKSSGEVSRFTIQGNRISDWSSLSPAIVFVGARQGAIRENTFARTDATNPLAISYASSCGVVTSGNLAWYTAWQDFALPDCQ